jgi:hypothetical protein
MRCSKVILWWIALTLCGGIGGQITGLAWWALANRLSSVQFMLITLGMVVPAVLLADLIPAFRKSSLLQPVVDCILLGFCMGAAATHHKHLPSAIAGMTIVGALSAFRLLEEWSQNRFGQRTTTRFLVIFVCSGSAFAVPALACGITLERLGVTGWLWIIALFSSGTLGAMVGARLGRRLADCVDRLEARHLERSRHSQ